MYEILTGFISLFKEKNYQKARNGKLNLFMVNFDKVLWTKNEKLWRLPLKRAIKMTVFPHRPQLAL